MLSLSKIFTKQPLNLISECLKVTSQRSIYTASDVKLTTLERGVDNKSAEYLSKFPLGKTPALELLEGPNNLKLVESNAIAYYIASAKEGSLLIGDTKEEWGDHHFLLGFS